MSKHIKYRQQTGAITDSGSATAKHRARRMRRALIQAGHPELATYVRPTQHQRRGHNEWWPHQLRNGMTFEQCEIFFGISKILWPSCVAMPDAAWFAYYESAAIGPRQEHPRFRQAQELAA